jgi:hypothetical protein
VTWVFGSPTWLGASVCVADIQVTIGNRNFDCLQKLYAIDANALAGFAGNVSMGFEMLSALARVIRLGKGATAEPTDAAALIDRFPDVARGVFARQPAEAQAGGSALLLAIGEPSENTLYGTTPHVVRFTSPTFEAQEVPRKEWASIGSGAGVNEYQAELTKVTGDEGDGLLQMEVGRPGGHARMMAQFVAMQVAELPEVKGISQHFHIGVAFADGCELTTTNRDLFPPDGPPQQIRMPKVASTWAELQDVVSSLAAGDPMIAIA